MGVLFSLFQKPTGNRRLEPDLIIGIGPLEAARGRPTWQPTRNPGNTRPSNPNNPVRQPAHKGHGVALPARRRDRLALPRHGLRRLANYNQKHKLVNA